MDSRAQRILVFAAIAEAIGGHKKAVKGEMLLAEVKRNFPEVEAEDIRICRHQMLLAGFVDYVVVDDSRAGSQAEVTCWILAETGVQFLNLLENKQV